VLSAYLKALITPLRSVALAMDEDTRSSFQSLGPNNILNLLGFAKSSFNVSCIVPQDFWIDDSKPTDHM